VALDTDIGDLESVRLGGGGVYQDWAVEAEASAAAMSAYGCGIEQDSHNPD
jgi:hypothetical protein